MPAVEFSGRKLCSYTLDPPDIEAFQNAIDGDFYFEFIYGEFRKCTDLTFQGGLTSNLRDELYSRNVWIFQNSLCADVSVRRCLGEQQLRSQPRNAVASSHERQASCAGLIFLQIRNTIVYLQMVAYSVLCVFSFDQTFFVDLSQFLCLMVEINPSVPCADDLPVWGFIGEKESEIVHGAEQNVYYLFTHYIFSITHNGDQVRQAKAIS